MLYMMIEEGRVKAAKDISSELKGEEATQDILLVGDSIIRFIGTSKLLSLNQEIKISKETIYRVSQKKVYRFGQPQRPEYSVNQSGILFKTYLDN